MKRILFSAALLASMSAMAQETYTNAELVTEDLNGTARYVGMGGAMEALGADISTIGTNPAGVGLCRRSSVNFSVGMLSQQDAGKSNVGEATHASFDQVGFVWSTRPSRWSNFNIAFNYKKSRNFNNILNVGGSLNGLSSQNANSYMNLMDAQSANPSGDWLNSYSLSQLDALYYKRFIYDTSKKDMYYSTATGYDLTRTTKGYVSEYDINVSGNVSNRLYLGLTIGFCDVEYKSWTSYKESLINSSDEAIGDVTINDQRHISGTGFNVKAGAVIFPVDENPFRIGLYVSTPTWYDLTTSNYTYMINNANTGGTPIDANYDSEGEYKYRVYTPWKFGVSLGHTVGNYLALGATYEYSDYSSISSRIIDGYDYYGETSSYKDANMNDHTEKSLKGVSTIKLGLEAKPAPEVAVRVGYNYVSPMYRPEALKDGTISSPGTYYSSTTDYTNWKATNRITCGLGYAKGSFAVDLAYQYSVTNGEFHPFMDSQATYSYDDGTSISVDNHADGVNVSNKRHQLLATFTYKF